MKQTPPQNDPDLETYISQCEHDGDFEWEEQCHHIKMFEGRVYNAKLKDISDVIYNIKTLQNMAAQLFDIEQSRLHSSLKVSAAHYVISQANKESKKRFELKETKIKAYKEALRANFKTQFNATK